MPEEQTKGTNLAFAARVVTMRVRFPIALKLILISGGLVLLLSMGFVILGLLSTQSQYLRFAAIRKAAEIGSLKSIGMTTARSLTDSMYAPLLNGDLDLIQDTVKSVASGQSGVVEAIVARPDGRKLAQATEGELGGMLPDDLLTRLKGVKGVAELDEMTTDTLPDKIGFGSRIELQTGATGRLLGYLYIAVSTKRIVEAMHEIEEERRDAVRKELKKTVFLGLGALLIGIVIAVLQGLRIGRSIGHLNEVAREVGEGNLEARAVPSSRDEIGVLCERFNDMTKRVGNLLRESMEKAALDKEIERANAIQSLLLPSLEEFKTAGLSYCGLCVSATQMGGDWWHHYPLDNNRVLLCVGDVTGHGIPSAMLTASAKACCDTFLLDNSEVDLSRFMRSLDHTIRQSGKGELVMTLFACVLDTRTMAVRFANAGHNFPLLLRNGKPQGLVATGGRLGDGGEYVPTEAKLQAGDLVVLYTDGLIECENKDGEEYGMRRFRRLLTQHQTEPLLSLRQRIHGRCL